MHAVMGIAPRRRPVAARKRAAAVTNDPRATYRGWDSTGSAADVEWLAKRVKQNRDEIGIAGDAPSCGTGQHLPAREPPRRAGPVLLDCIETDHQQHVGSLASHIRQARSRELAQAVEPVGIAAAGT